MAKLPSMKTDNPLFSFMGKLGDVVLLNVTWLVCCLPVVTAGAATTALFYAARKLAAGEEYRVCRDFFHSFRANMKQATAFWLALLAALAVAGANLWTGLHTGSALGNVCRGVGAVLLVLWLALVGYAFPLLARYDYRLGRLALDALRLAVTRPHITVIHILLAVWLPAMLFLDPNVFAFFLPLWLLAGGAASAVAVSGLLLPVQREIESKKEGPDHADPETEARL